MLWRIENKERNCYVVIKCDLEEVPLSSTLNLKVITFKKL